MDMKLGLWANSFNFGPIPSSVVHVGSSEQEPESVFSPVLLEFACPNDVDEVLQNSGSAIPFASSTCEGSLGALQEEAAVGRSLERSLLEDEDETNRLMEEVGRVSSLVGLELEGSTEFALQRVALSAIEVVERRRSAKVRSRLELELRRLGASVDDVHPPSTRRRASGYVEPIPFSNDA
ncbi:hypothetical protein LINGRAHAP2_LOCUS2582 [Linum grandiflorum]